MLYIVLPAYNEEASISTILNNILNLSKKNLSDHKILIVIVNDGSEDNTEKTIDNFISSTLINEKNISIKKINHKMNQGLGAALKSGFEYVISSAKDEDILISLDCDNTHPINLISSMVDKVTNGKDLVIASRYQKNSKTIGVPFSRRMLSFSASILFKLFFPIKNVKDYTCGFRAYRINILKKTQENITPFFSESGFPAMVDILLKIKKYYGDINAEELPMILRYDFKKGKSKMSVQKNIIQTLKLILKRRFSNKI
tara:strand:- start:1869 stop:2639 length:771 start_codon:yes stop_codon:yes gene_type:complete